jgi:hypothetical protein
LKTHVLQYFGSPLEDQAIEPTSAAPGRLRSGKLFSAATDHDIRQGNRDGVPAVGEGEAVCGATFKSEVIDD